MRSSNGIVGAEDVLEIVSPFVNDDLPVVFVGVEVLFAVQKDHAPPAVVVGAANLSGSQTLILLRRVDRRATEV